MYLIDKVNLYIGLVLAFSILFPGVFYKDPFTFETGIHKKRPAKKIEKIKMTRSTSGIQ